MSTFPGYNGCADKKNPNKGVTVKMSSNGTDVSCSLSVSVICDSNGVQVSSHSLYLFEMSLDQCNMRFTHGM